MGDALVRAQTILNLPREQKDLKILITEENLKAAGFLPSRVGTLLPFTKFKSGVPLGVPNSKRRAGSPSDSGNDDRHHQDLGHGIGRALSIIYFAYR